MSDIPWTKCEKIGAGTYAVVYRCENKSLNKVIALKQFNIDGKGKTEIFYNESGILRNLDHKNIVKYYGVIEHEDSVGILMEHVSGGTVRKLIAEKGPLREETIQKFSQQILEGLAYLHERQIMHRDIKCSNVLLDKLHNCKLTDFGLSKKNENIRSRSGAKTECGSSYWMSPETLSGETYGWKADIWSFGCTVFEMLNKEPPYYGCTTFMAWQKVTKEGITPPSSASRDCREFMEKCFRMDARNRPSAEELLDDRFILRFNESQNSNIARIEITKALY